MSKIALLDQHTINKIAAGEVVERPASVVKELVENAIDAGSTAITVEIKDGGISFIRITDNGSGIDKEDIPVAFLRHSTSKIKCVEDLLTIGSLGFRGEALSSISSVAQVELITKTRAAFMGIHYEIHGGADRGMTDIGCPDGTTIIVRNLFFNTPARQKFLKTAMTEAGYINDYMERLAISHPEIAFKFINNNKTIFYTSGNNKLKDCIYAIYGRDIAMQLVEVDYSDEFISISGYIAKPVVSRGNRNYENYFINGRYIKSNIITKAIEEAYKPYTMQHKYPFTCMHFEIPSNMIDVNVHPAKMEIRLYNGDKIYYAVMKAIGDALSGRNMIPDAVIGNESKAVKESVRQDVPEPFETKRMSSNSTAALMKTGNGATAAKISAAFDSNSGVKEIHQEKAAMHSGIQQASALTITKDTEIGRLNSVVNGGSNKAASLSENYIKDDISSQNIEKTKEKPQLKGLLLKETKETLPDADEKAAISVKATAAENDNPVTTDILKNSAKMAENQVISENPESEKLYNEGNIAEESRLVRETSISENGYNNIKGQAASEYNNNQEKHTAFMQDEGQVYKQATLFEQTEEAKDAFLDIKSVKRHKIIGQLFLTYWLVEFDNQLYIIDQHAAHEKILYENTMKRLADKEYLSQMVSPPAVVSLNLKEAEVLEKYSGMLKELGFGIEHFGGKEYLVNAVPADMCGIDGKLLLTEIIDGLSSDIPQGTPDVILEKVASMSCKAAVKGNSRLSVMEAQALIDDLMKLDNPFHCPHGRPVIVSMTKYEIEKKFKRIV